MPAKPRAKPAKKVYISVDFEGAACVIGQPSDPTQPLGSGLEANSAIFQQAQRLVTAETNAAIRGALKAGATEIIVEDNHGSGHNLLYEQLDPAAQVIMGGPRPKRFCLLDDSFTGLVLLCHHTMAGVQGGILSHSYSSKSVHRMILNNRPIGEIGFDAALAGERGVPVILVTGDEATGAEARDFLGADIETVATKRGISRNCALSLSPAAAQARTEAAMTRALQRRDRRKPLKLKGPHVLDRVFKWESQADAAVKELGARRMDPYTVRWRGPTIESLAQ